MVVEAIFYQEEDGTCPVLEFLKNEPQRVRQQARERIILLKERGHTARRPLVEYLGEGLYELRWHTQRVQYRILYFFHGQKAVVLSHALTKEDKIPLADRNRALRRKSFFEANPAKHTYQGETL
ncbi:MAG: type II toxin-antitoxin system RelE/ParE family toxin [Planctomycetes bacterium]|nr:type II toxin-antitoxin system RelE/ParE family toxin [Planctomycetota bacterium]